MNNDRLIDSAAEMLRLLEDFIGMYEGKLPPWELEEVIRGARKVVEGITGKKGQ